MVALPVYRNVLSIVYPYMRMMKGLHILLWIKTLALTVVCARKYVQCLIKRIKLNLKEFWQQRIHVMRSE